MLKPSTERNYENHARYDMYSLLYYRWGGLHAAQCILGICAIGWISMKVVKAPITEIIAKSSVAISDYRRWNRFCESRKPDFGFQMQLIRISIQVHWPWWNATPLWNSHLSFRYQHLFANGITVSRIESEDTSPIYKNYSDPVSSFDWRMLLTWLTDHDTNHAHCWNKTVTDSRWNGNKVNVILSFSFSSWSTNPTSITNKTKQNTVPKPE